MLVATIQRGDQTVTVTLPDSGNAASGAADATDAVTSAATGAANYAVVFRSYKRIDGSFDVPLGATLMSVEARIMERGTIRVRQTAVPSDTPPT